MSQHQPLSYAIIHVGSSTMSISIVEYRSIDDIRQIEFASREVTFGEELFQTNRLAFDTIHEICTVLKGYRDLMEAYGVTEYKAFATSVIREAENRRFILDQIYVQAGLEIEVLEMPREVYFKYFALYRNMGAIGMTDTQDAVLFVDVTSGGLGITVWQGGALLYQQNMHMGTIRVLESFNRTQRASQSFSSVVEEVLSSMLQPIVRELHKFRIKYLVLSGDEPRTIAHMMGINVKQNNVIVNPQQFEDLYRSFDGVTTIKLMNRFHMPEHRANIIMPMMVLYHEILQLVTVNNMFVNNTTFREGAVLYYGASKEAAPYLRKIRLQNLQLARSIAERYHYDVNNSEKIEAFGSVILNTLSEWSGLNERSAFLFRMAAILHGVGKHINLRKHNAQSYNIIMGTDLFGLSEAEKKVVANIAYYYYKGDPDDEDDNFRSLSEPEKMMTIKLTAIFRLARALDQSHKQKIKTIDVSLKNRELLIEAHCGDEDISLERWIFEEESRYFGEVFGLTATLRQRR